MKGREKNTAVLQKTLDHAERAGDGEEVSGQELIEKIGERSFGPLLLVPSLVLVSPASAIFGLPTIGAVVIALISVQMLIGRESIWVPQRLRRLKIKRSRLITTKRYLLPVARVVDRFTYPRLSFLVIGVARRVIAGICLIISTLMPPLEIVPMANTTTAAAVAFFALAITARDGLMAVIALAATAVGIALTVTQLLE